LEVELNRLDVGEWLKDAGATQADLARWAGVDAGTLSKWLTGATKRLKPAHRAAIEAAIRARRERKPRRAKAVETATTATAEGDALKDATRPHIPAAVAVLVEMMADAESESVRLQAALSLLQYAYGKPRQHVPSSGPKLPAQDAELLAKLERLGSAPASPTTTATEAAGSDAQPA
jgi:DNA-binding transcriptional regulator YdaS (Cro superfamily)